MAPAVDSSPWPRPDGELSEADMFSARSRYVQALIAGCHEVMSSAPGEFRARADLRALLDEGPPRGRPLWDPR